jgi:hypothetical protein
VQDSLVFVFRVRRQESAAYMLRQEQVAAELPMPELDTVNVSASLQVQKRPAPVAADDVSCSKKLRMADHVQELEEEYQDCPDWCAPDPIEAEGDMDRFTCTVEELLGEPKEENKEQAENNIQQFVPPFPEPAADLETEEFEELEMLLADGDDNEELLGETKEQAENNIKQFAPHFPEPASDWETEEYEEHLQMLLADLGDDDEEERDAKAVEEFMMGIDNMCKSRSGRSPL